MNTLSYKVSKYKIYYSLNNDCFLHYEFSINFKPVGLKCESDFGINFLDDFYEEISNEPMGVKIMLKNEPEI